MLLSKIQQSYCSGGCNPVNWLNQTRRSLTIEHLNLNFVTTPKLTPFHLVYAEKGFCFLRLAHFHFASGYTSKPFPYRYFAAYRFEFKVFNQVGTRWYFELVVKEKMFGPRKCQESSWRSGNRFIRHRKLMLLHTPVVARKFFRENFF